MPNPKIIDPEAVLPFGYIEDKESGEENYNWTTGEITATRIFKGPWEYRVLFLQTFYLQATGSGGNNIIFAPASHPEIEIPAIKANVVGKLSTGINPETNYIKHDIAIVRVDYSTQNNKGSGPDENQGDLEDLYIEESIESSIELFPITAQRKTWTGPTSANKVNPDDPVVGHTPGGGPLYPSYPGNETFEEQSDLTTTEVTRNVRIIKINYRLSAPYVINPLWERLGNAAGTVNWIPFTTPSGLVAAPDTLRYDGISGVTKREISTLQLVWAIDVMFQYYKKGHNTEPTVEFTNPKGRKTYIKHALVEPLLFYPYPMQALFRDITTAEIQAMNSNTFYGGIDEWGGNIDAILRCDHIETQGFN